MEKERRVVGSLFQRRCSITKRSIREFGSRSEFRMGQIKTKERGLNIEKAIEIGRCNKLWVIEIILY